MRAYLLSLQTQAWRTAGARYSAARRLRRRDLFATASIAMFSVLGIALAFVQRILVTNQGGNLDNYLTAISVCLGVFVLAVSLMEWGAGNALKADTLQRNAESLNAFQRKISQILAQLDAGVQFSWDVVEGLRVEYESIKERSPHNHEPLDDLEFRASHRLAKEFAGDDGGPRFTRVGAWWVRARWLIASIWYFTLFWLVLIAVLYLAISSRAD